MPRYTEAQGVVSDGVTGLAWQQAVPANQCPSDMNGGCSWDEAKAYCTSLVLGGTGWRLPDLWQLFSILVPNNSNAGVTAEIDPTAFPSTPKDNFWSSTLFSSSGSPGSIDFGYKYSSPFDYGASVPLPVRCVR